MFSGFSRGPARSALRSCPVGGAGQGRIVVDDAHDALPRLTMASLLGAGPVTGGTIRHAAARVSPAFAMWLGLAVSPLATAAVVYLPELCKLSIEELLLV